MKLNEPVYEKKNVNSDAQASLRSLVRAFARINTVRT